MTKRIIRIHVLFAVILACSLFLLQIFQRAETNPQKKSDIHQIQAKSIAKDCKDQKTWKTCYGERLAEVVTQKGFTFFLKTLEKLKEEDNRTKDCHVIAHFASHAAVKKDPSRWNELLSQVELSDCYYGYIHGSLESLSAHDSAFEVSVENAPALCKKIADIKTSLDPERGCSHVVGHLLLSQKCNRPVENMISETVNQCKSLPKTMQHECFAGAFMESFTRGNLELECGTEHIEWNLKTAENQARLCNSYTGEAALSCWQEISHIYTKIHPDNPEGVYKACQQAPQRNQALLCYYHSLVTLISNQNKDSDYFRNACHPLVGDDSEYKKCISSAVGSIVTPSLKSIDSGLRFCEAYPSKYGSDCYGTIVYYLRAVTSGSERKMYCGKLPKEYHYACINLPNKDSSSF